MKRIQQPGLPIVDLCAILGTTTSIEGSETEIKDSKWKSVATVFTEALMSFGFTYITGHGIPESMIHEAFEVSKDFFQLDKETKAGFWADPEKHYHGYNHRQLQLGSTLQDMREIFDCCGVSRRYPTEQVPRFQPVLESLEHESKRVLKLLMRLLAEALELDQDYFLKVAKYLDDSNIPSSSTFRSLFYRGIGDGVEVPSGTVRTKEHTDHGILTLLFQDDIGGLEVKSKGDNWIKAVPIPGTLVVNTGDLLDFWTGGLIPATPHRVMIPTEESKHKLNRQSLAYFVHPDDTTVITPITSPKIRYENQTGFEPLTAYEFAMKKMERVY